MKEVTFALEGAFTAEAAYGEPASDMQAAWAKAQTWKGMGFEGK